MVVTISKQNLTITDFGIEDKSSSPLTSFWRDYVSEYDSGKLEPKLVDPKKISFFLRHMNDVERISFLKNGHGDFLGVMEYSCCNAKDFSQFESYLESHFPRSDEFGCFDSVLLESGLVDDVFPKKVGHIQMFETYEKRKGYGSFMHNAVCKHNDFDTIFLEAWNEISRRFYQNKGFREADNSGKDCMYSMIWNRHDRSR